MDEGPKSLQALFSSAKSQKKALESSPSINDPSHEDQLNSAVRAFEACQKLISKLSIFSPNESLDDIATVDLQYLSSLLSALPAARVLTGL